MCQVILAAVVELFLVTTCATTGTATCTGDVSIGLLALPKAGGKMVQLVVSTVPTATAYTTTTAVVLLLVSRDHGSRGVLVFVLVVLQVARRRLRLRLWLGDCGWLLLCLRLRQRLRLLLLTGWMLLL